MESIGTPNSTDKGSLRHLLAAQAIGVRLARICPRSTLLWKSQRLPLGTLAIVGRL